MKKTAAILAGLALTTSMASMAIAAQEQETQEYDPDRDIVTETERDHGAGMEMSPEDSPVQSEYGTEPETQTESDMGTHPYGEETGTELSEMTAEELSGKSVVTSTGEEIGEIGEVGYSATHQERVATVEVGGFLGVGEKRIALPLSELEPGEDDTSVQTSLTRESIEAQEEFDEAGFTIDE